MKIIQLTTDNREHLNDYENPEPHFGAAPEALLEGFSLLPDTEVHVVSCFRRSAASPAIVFGNLHYHSLLVPKSGWMTTFYQGCIRATRKLVREIGPAIVHGQGTERDCAMSAVYSGFPNVLTIHGNMAELNRLGDTFKNAPLYGFMSAHLETHALGKTRGVFCNSAYTESLVAPRAQQTWRVPNAIRGAFFGPTTRSPGGNKVPLILNVGHLGSRKRQIEIIQMMAALHREGHALHIVFTGSPPGNDPYGQAFAVELKKAEATGFASHAGFLSASQLIHLMDEADGFIHFPSEEAFGLVVAEAMARELKFFGANLGGIKEIASGVPGAELHDDFASLKQGIARWLESGAPILPQAASLMHQRYSPEVVARQHVEIYRELLGH